MEPMTMVIVFLVDVYLLLSLCIVSALNVFFSPSPPDVDTDDSEHSSQSYHSEKTLSERLEILTNQGLIQVVKVFVDWLRTNTDIVLMCAQV